MSTSAPLAERIAEELLHAWNSHDIDRIVEFYAADFEGEDISQAAIQRGLEGIRGTVERYFQAFPDLEFTECETIVQGNRTVQRWKAQGTHKGTLMNIPATGRRVEVHGASFLTVEGGKVTRATMLWDVAGMLRGIGLLPDL